MGDYSRKLDRYTNVSGSTVLAVGDNLSVTARVLIGLSANSPVVQAGGNTLTANSLYIQRIVVHVLTDNAATLTFQDDASTPVVIAGTKASPGIGPIVFDFGPEGRKLTEAKQFTLKNSGAGLVADITWVGYQRLTGAVQA